MKIPGRSQKTKWLSDKMADKIQCELKACEENNSIDIYTVMALSNVLKFSKEILQPWIVLSKRQLVFICNQKKTVRWDIKKDFDRKNGNGAIYKSLVHG